MSILRKSYEISIWKNVIITENNQTTVTEQRVAIIGSDTMTSPYRALEPKLKRKINGSNEFTFKMHRTFCDNVTGEKAINPFVDLLTNETIIKVKYDGKWYDLIIKNVSQSSDNSTYSYTASDLHINELSKNGYDIELNNSLMNNSGTVEELAEKILRGTNWDVGDCDNLTETTNEYLVEFIAPNTTKVRYAYYSSCYDRPSRFQWIEENDLGTKVDSDGVYIPNAQNYLDNPIYVTDAKAVEKGLYYPSSWQNEGWEYSKISVIMAQRDVYNHRSHYNPVLNKVVYEYYKTPEEATTNIVDERAVEAYTAVEYTTPVLIKNLVTNNQFLSTSGWKGRHFDTQIVEDPNAPSTYDAKVAATTEPSMFDENGKFADASGITYKPCLEMTFPSAYSCVVNSGFYDNLFTIGNLANGDKYVLYYKPKAGSLDNINDSKFSVYVSTIEYDSNNSNYPYDLESRKVPNFLFFSGYYNNNQPGFAKKLDNGYYYSIGVVSNNSFTKEEFQKKRPQIFIRPYDDRRNALELENWQRDITLAFEDFQIFPYIPKNGVDGVPLTPDSQSLDPIITTKLYAYDVKNNEGIVDADDYEYLSGYAGEEIFSTTDGVDLSKTPIFGYSPRITSEKIRQPSIGQSNYFNAIQTLCETFECWADFEIEHDDIGRIINRKVKFRKSVGQPNYAGFRYGVNLKSSKRTIESKAIVTKLIVPDITTQYANAGFCSISRAAANYSKENYIYNFNYYYNTGLLDKVKMEGVLSEHLGVLHDYNLTIQRLADQYSKMAVSLAAAYSKQQVAEKGLKAAEEVLEELNQKLIQLTGQNYATYTAPMDGETRAGVKECLASIGEALVSKGTYSIDLATAERQYNDYKDKNANILNDINLKTDEKQNYIKEFTKIYSQFIQEGTWKGNDYLDDSKYYLDALSTSNNSCLPKSTYDFGVLDLSQLKDYEGFTFQLGDQTWVEDPELFGENRIEVVVSEITYNFDEPDKNTVKVQNFRNQFADLFQKMTATTQQVQFASDAWQKAAGFVQSTATEQSVFLQNALNDAKTTLANAGDQSVIIDKNGITVADLSIPNKQIRIVGGAIMLRDDNDDLLGWKTGITADGISAKLITTGQLNTGMIQIMNGEDPTFRWDELGITAYGLDVNENGVITKYDYNKGVRFDRFGIYGYDGIDGLSWRPQSEEEIEDNSVFALTRKGVSFKVGEHSYKTSDGNAIKIKHTSHTKLGRAGDYIYNYWDNDGIPKYNSELTAPEFVKVLSVGTAAANNDANENLVIYDDGTLVANNIRFTGSVQWSESASPIKSVYNRSAVSLPENGTKYSSFVDEDNENANVWHKKYDPDTDQWYAHTEDGGATWTGPFPAKGIKGEKGDKGDQGEQGIQGVKGDNGKNGTETRILYKATDSKDVNGKPLAPFGLPGVSSDAGWEEKYSTPTSDFPYVWVVTSSKVYDDEIVVQNTQPELYAVYNDAGVDPVYYADYAKATNFTTDGLYYGTGENGNGLTQGQLYIRASSLEVLKNKDKKSAVENFLFFANKDTNVVYLGGFTIQGTKNSSWLYYNLSWDIEQPNTSLLVNDKSFFIAPGGMCNSSTGTGLVGETNENYKNWALGIGKNFGITTEGILCANSVNLSGSIEATDGSIGGFNIGTIKLNNQESKCLSHGLDTGGTPPKNGNFFALGSEIFGGFGPTGSGDAFGLVTGQTGSYIFLGGKTDENSLAPFCVTQDGTIGAKKAVFGGGTNKDGRFTFDKIDRKIGGSPMTITYMGTHKLDVANFIVQQGIVAENRIYLGTDGFLIAAPEDKYDSYYYATGIRPGMVVLTGDSSNLGNLHAVGRYSQRGFSIYGHANPEKNNPYTGSLSSSEGWQEIGGINYFNWNGIESKLVLTGKWQLNDNSDFNTGTNSTTQTSDRNSKNTISQLSSAYTVLFDNLKPVSYKYNKGTSSRIHIGFIAQEVEEAILTAGLTTQDFAAYIDDGSNNDDACSLRYDEFVAINTQQIQLLKPRMTTAEQEIEILRAEMRQLRTELAALQEKLL